MLNLNKNKIIPATEMLELNKNKLIPATEIIAYWGEIKGDISKQTDLVELTTDLDTSIKGWVESKGYLTEHQDLSDYAKKTEIPSLTGYATESWVESKGYVTAETLPEGIATEDWVQSQGYLTENEIFNSDGLRPLFARNNGYLKHQTETIDDIPIDGMSNKILSVPINSTNINILCNCIDDRVYMYNPYESRFFVFDNTYLSFVEYTMTITGSAPKQIYPMWRDIFARVYYGNSYELYIDHQSRTVTLEERNLGGEIQYHSSSMKSNIIKKDMYTIMISYSSSCAYIFNENIQQFDVSIPIRGTFPSETFYRYLSEFEGHWIYDVGKEQTELVFHLDEAEPYAEWVTLPERLFPGEWSYEYEGQTINEKTRGVYVHPVVKDGVTEYYHFGYRNPVMYKLVNGAWEIVSYNNTVENMTTSVPGCAFGTLWFGYGYQKGHKGEIIIWNMGDSPYYIEETTPEFYGWYDLDSDIENINSDIENINSDIKYLRMDVDGLGTDLKPRMDDLEERMTSLETNYGDALNITNQILG